MKNESMHLVTDAHLVLLSGGGGGAKLAGGISREFKNLSVTVVSNTGDDFEHFGLSISPDTDSLLYAMSGQLDKDRGWGRSQESWKTLDEIRRLGGSDWFQLGDKDLALHLLRQHLLKNGMAPSEVTEILCEKFGLNPNHMIIPATDSSIRTRIVTDEGDMAFQHYFVKLKCQPKVRSIYFEGIGSASPSQKLKKLLRKKGAPVTVVLGPSNPFLSLAPILDIPGMLDLIREEANFIVAISPIVGGQALKGPAAKIMSEFGFAATAEGWIRYLEMRYPGLVDEWVLDDCDACFEKNIDLSRRKIKFVNTVMSDECRCNRFSRWLVENCFNAR